MYFIKTKDRIFIEHGTHMHIFLKLCMILYFPLRHAIMRVFSEPYFPVQRRNRSSYTRKIGLKSPFF